MGLRLNTFRSPRAYTDVVYAKGGFALHMLRGLRWDKDTHDQSLIDMMHDFVQSSFNQNASTEVFRAVVEKHMKPGMDLGGDHTM